MKTNKPSKTFWPESQLTLKNFVAWIIALLLTLTALYYFSGLKNFYNH